MAGLAVTRHGYGRPTRHIPVIEAGHPVPDEAGLAATERALALADAAGADDLVLVLLSGGASANWIAPAPGLTLAEKQAVTRALLRSGAGDRRDQHAAQASLAHQGRAAGARAHPARIVTLAISDVPGDDPAVIGSGPTVPDPTTLADARAIVARYRLDLPEAVTRALADPANETPKPGDPVFADTDVSGWWRGRPTRFRAAEAAVRAPATTASCSATASKARRARSRPSTRGWRASCRREGRRAVILSGRRADRDGARQGPRRPQPGIRAGARHRARRRGRDCGAGRRYRRHRRRRRHARTTRPGALVDGTTGARARALGLDPAAFLADNDSTGFFARLGDLLVPGPTFTNVNDFRAIVVDRP